FLIPVSSPEKPPPKERGSGPIMEGLDFYTLAAAAPHTMSLSAHTSQRRGN
ncbi:MAG: hypothetical protein HDS65_10060, partial [Bacteroidales bacterium]|nr:hypothetical protein [Bacteroidales bacterium]